MANIYLPVEISRREIVAKSMLAGRLAADGHQVLIFHSDLFDRVGWPGSGLYIGKNVFRTVVPHDLKFQEKMKRAGVRIWHLDEEGGVYLGATEREWRETLANRVDMASLGADDKVLTWGDWQREYFEEQGLRADTRTVGYLNFDICRPQYHDAFAEFDAKETGGLSGYILVNTRFTLNNGRDFGGRHVIHEAMTRNIYSERILFEKLVADGKCYYEFIGLIYALSQNFPNRKIVLRPHPGEEPSIYERIVGPLENVIVTGAGDVGSWIRRSHAVVHNGCTTAIQAVIADKPVVTFLPASVGPEMDSGLPNKSGILARSVSEVIAAIETPPEHGDSGAWHRTISSLDTIESLAAMVAEEADRLAPATPLPTVQRLVAHGAVSELARAAARGFIPGRRRLHRARMAHFDPKFFGRIEDMVHVARKLYGAEIGLRKLSNRCFAFVPPEAGDGTAKR